MGNLVLKGRKSPTKAGSDVVPRKGRATLGGNPGKQMVEKCWKQWLNEIFMGQMVVKYEDMSFLGGILTDFVGIYPGVCDNRKMWKRMENP